MTQVSILQGTRMGRPVKREAEVLAEFRDYKAPEEGSCANPISEPLISPALGQDRFESRIDHRPNGVFQFFNIPYQGRVLGCVERRMQYLYGGAARTQERFLEWLSDLYNNKEGCTIADTELEYQMRRIAFDLRDDKEYGAFAREYIQELQTRCDAFILTASHIQYKAGLRAIVSNRNGFQSKSWQVEIPTYPNNHLVLSKVRPETQLEQVFAIDSATSEFLKVYLGEGFERAGMVLPYCASRISGNLRETILTTLPDEHMADAERVGAMGPDLLGRFDLNANVQGAAKILPVRY